MWRKCVSVIFVINITVNKDQRLHTECVCVYVCHGAVVLLRLRVLLYFW